MFTVEKVQGVEFGQNPTKADGLSGKFYEGLAQTEICF